MPKYATISYWLHSAALWLQSARKLREQQNQLRRTWLIVADEDNVITREINRRVRNEAHRAILAMIQAVFCLRAGSRNYA